MADSLYGCLGFVSTLLLNDVFGWIHIADVGKAMILGMVGAAGGWAAKHALDYIKKTIKKQIQKHKTK